MFTFSVYVAKLTEMLQLLRVAAVAGKSPVHLYLIGCLHDPANV